MGGQWTAIGPAHWSGGRLILDGAWHGSGVPIGGTQAEAEGALRGEREAPLPDRGLQLVESPEGDRHIWDPIDERLRPLAPEER